MPGEEAFQRLLKSSNLPDGLVQLSVAEANRGLAVARDVQSDATILSIPWTCALLPSSTLQRLQRDESLKQGMLPTGIGKLQRMLSGDQILELPKASHWILLLVLHLLRELRHPRSSWTEYVQLLPSPPGSLVKRVCCHGPDSTDLLMFSDAELEQLENDHLVQSVKAERERIASLHRRLFAKQGQEAVIGLDSFVWAHVLVRSRSLDLTGFQEGKDAGGGEIFRERCMLPVIDLCNHASVEANCSLAVRLQPSGQPWRVDVVAKRDLTAGEELLLNYGDKPLSEFLQSYGFTPAGHPHEVFEDLGAVWEALHVRGAAKGSMLWLSTVHLLPQASATEGSGSGCPSLVYSVSDAATLSREGATYGAILVAPAKASSQSKYNQPGKLVVQRLDACREAWLAFHVAHEAQSLLKSYPSTIVHDERELAILRSSNKITDIATCTLGVRLLHAIKAEGAFEHSKWFQKRHAELALEYRLERKRLLEQLSQDLLAQSKLLR